MKVSILVFCLAVIFGSISCKTYINRTNTDDVIKGAADGNHNTNYFSLPFENSLSKYKRPNTLASITKIGHLIGIDSNNLIRPILNFSDFIIGLVTGQDGLCPEKSFTDLIGEIQNPIQMIKTIFCYIFNIIGTENRAIVQNLFNTFSKFLRTIFLPTLHEVLNKIANTGILPPSLKSLVDTFNVLYNVLKITGYVG